MTRFQQSAYWDMMYKAEYYAWCALRGHTLPGNDPLRGNERKRTVLHFYDSRLSKESQVAYCAMSRYWINTAKEYRRQLSE